MALTIIRAIDLIGFCFVSGPVSLLAASFVVLGTQSAVAGMRVALVCGLFPSERRQIDILAKLRALSHVSYAAGASLGAVVLGYNDLVGFYVGLLLNAATFFIFTIIIVLPPKDNPIEKISIEGDIRVLHDFPYLTIMGVTMLFALCWSPMSTALPLWVHQRTTAPQYLPGLPLAAFSLLIAFFQVQVSKKTQSVGGGGQASLLTGWILGGRCILFASSGYASPILASILLIAGTLFVIAGEIYFIAGKWILSIVLMNKEFKGRYQGVTSSLETMITAVGPAFMSLVVI